MTDEDYQAWLQESQASRVLLVEMEHSAGTVYLATTDFISLPDDTDPNRIYDDALVSAVDIPSRIDSHLNIGDIKVIDDGTEVFENAGWYWSTLLCMGYAIRLYLGGADWSRDDFRLVAKVVNGGIRSSKRGIATFQVIDSRAEFSQPLHTAHLTSGKPEPITLGLPFNVKPALKTDASSPVYKLNSGAITSSSVRVNGISETPSATDYPIGELTLTARPNGNLTIDPVETNDTAKKMVEWVCARYGLTTDISSLNALPTYELGLYYSTETQAKRVLDDIALSVGGYWRFNLNNQVQMLQILEPDPNEDLIIQQDDIVENGVNLERVEQPCKKVTINYKRNFSVVDRDSVSALVASNPTLAKEMTEQWQQVTVENVVTNHPLAQDKIINTYITNSVDAAIEANRQAMLRGVRREIWSVECFVAPALVLVGETVKVTYDKFGFENGRNGLVISVEKTLTNNRIRLLIWL